MRIKLVNACTIVSAILVVIVTCFTIVITITFVINVNYSFWNHALTNLHGYVIQNIQ